ncbi:WecB/TagA/CpsF family glycosyltransferase [Martelella radicis]|uniref:Exopolysaccharide biosynthesis WecB/TagA/CpsF family protein n=1 Tax=Martelella radicis TaxID=1397476 RepID=A0A7W6KGD8_9HYPH|nr:WecB/TagA/CpsF family glycosyltransferase [Martelella radicis]MBB4120628.1 exopolysaccharide biosynthesis WecB/TagA/CpsF family protein [Martelella radicis]
MAAFKTVSLFGLPIVSASQHAAVTGLLEAPQEKRTAAFLNAHCMNTHKDDASYRWAVSKADYLLPDGSGMKLAARLQKKSFEANLNGTDLFVPLCQEAARLGRSIFFFGSQDGVADAAANRACELAPGLKIAGTRHGFFAKDDEADIIDAINRSGADIVLVALGVPLQDVWIARNRHKLNAGLVMGVGAQFDFFSGRVTRAPVIFRKAGCEWVWRLMMEPRRMAKRYLVGNFRFVFNAWREARAVRAGAPAATPVRGKRLLDIAVASSALLMLSPLMASTALAVAATSRGPVFFRQTRIGENGKPFTMLKFRSMYRDAEARRAALLETSDREGICFKSRTDPRITPVGRIMRRLSIDELPQIINVLKGDMSIVGPRPALPQEVAAYAPEAMSRLGAKPGITGLWQVSGRAEIGFDRMLEMDNAYIRSRSIVLDLTIIALTARAVFSGRGAY